MVPLRWVLGPPRSGPGPRCGLMVLLKVVLLYSFGGSYNASLNGSKQYFYMLVVLILDQYYYKHCSASLDGFMIPLEKILWSP